jgi:hypothetical protein
MCTTFYCICFIVDGAGLSAIDPTRYADRFMKGCVIDAFEGLNVLTDRDFNPKNKHHTTKTYTPPGHDAVLPVFGKSKAGIDKRFSAAPLESSMV